MTRRLAQAFTPEDWKRGIALVILWAYGYQLVVWPILWWLVAIANAYGVVMPLPPLVPWEQLVAGTGTLATVGGIQAWRDNKELDAAPSTVVTHESRVVTRGDATP